MAPAADRGEGRLAERQPKLWHRRVFMVLALCRPQNVFGQMACGIRHAAIAREIVDVDDVWPVLLLGDVETVQLQTEGPPAASRQIFHLR